MKGKFTRVTALVAAALLGTAGLSACRGGGVIQTGENCLDVYCHEAGYGEVWCENLLEAFVKKDWVKEKYPNVKYTFASNNEEGYIKGRLVSPKTNHYDLLFGFIQDTPNDHDLLEDLTDGVYKQKVPDEGVAEADRLTYEEKSYESYNQMNAYVTTDSNGETRYFKTSWAGGLTGIFYNADILERMGEKVPRTTDELTALCNKVYADRTDGDSTDAYEGYAFIQSKGLAYWMYMFPQWWAQYEGIDGYTDYWNGIAYDELSSDIFKQKGRLHSLEMFETYLEYDKHLDPKSMSESYTYKIAQGLFLRGNGLFHVNGDWFENEMKDIKAEIKQNEGIDYTIKLMRTPIISNLGTKLGITDAQLAATVDYVDGVTTTKPDGVADDVIERVREARGVVYSIGAMHDSFLPSYAQDKDVAKDFLLFMATDEAQEIYMKATGSSLPFKYDVATKNPELYASLTPMQKANVDYFNSDTVSVVTLPISEAFPLVKYGGLRDFSVSDYNTLLSMNNRTTSAQKIYDNTIAYWHEQRWDTAITKAGLK